MYRKLAINNENRGVTMHQGHVVRCLRHAIIGCLLAHALMATALFPPPAGAAVPPASFTELSGSPYPIGTSPISVAIGDLNGDGRLDIVTADFFNGDVSVLLGNVNGTLNAAVSVPMTTGSQPYAVAIGDLNGDGKPDLAVANYGSNGVSVLMGNGNGTFAEAPSPLAVGANPVSITIGDVDGDGKPDLVTANNSSGNVSVLIANGSGAFQVAVNYPVGASPRSALLGDVNNDGKPDLLVANRASDSVSVLLGAGGGTFRSALSQAANTTPHAIAVGDLNGDNKLDLVVANYSDNSISVLLGKGDGAFTASADAPMTVGRSPDAVAIGDLNGDGKADLFVANYDDSSVTVLLGNGDGTFAAAPNTPFAVGEQPRSIAIGDLNGDGALDLIVANFGDTSKSVSVLRNTTAPPAAARLNVTASAGSGTAGAPFSLTVTAQTATNATATGYTGTVTFTSSDPKATLPANYRYTATDRGIHTFNTIILAASGDHTITATDTTTAAIAGIVTISVAQASTTTSLTADHNPATVNQPVTFTAMVHATTTPSPGTAVSFLDADAPIGSGNLDANGQATFRTAALTVGVHTITARYSGDGAFAPSTSPSLAQRINVGAAASLIVSGFPSTVIAGVAGTATITVKDAFGNTATGYSGTVHYGLGTSDPAATLPADYVFTNADSGTHTFSVTLAKAGPQSITVSDTVGASITGLQSGIVVTNAAASSIIANAGTTHQNAQVTKPFATNFAVTVTDAFSNPVGGASVTFTAPTTGASGTFANGNTTASTSTDGSGVASAPAFTANTATGDYTVTARATGVGAAASFTLSNIAGPPGTITATTGTSQSVTVGKVFPISLAVLVKDAGGNPVDAGITVTFTAPASSASGAFTGGSITATVTTNGSGIATAPVFTANMIAGAFIVVGTAPGVATPARFNLTNLPDVPATLTISAGSGQSAPITTAFATALAVQITDANRNPIRDLAVVFTAPASGASGTFAGGSTMATVSTNASGIATAPSFTASGAVGAYLVTAAATGVRPASFALTNLAGPADHLALAAPASIQQRTSFTLTITASDASGSTATGYTGIVHITSSDAQAILPADAALTNGVGAFVVTLRSVGSQHITATDRTILSITGGVTVNVSDPPPTPNPTPTLSSLNPTSVIAGGGAFILTINGTGFLDQSVVRWNDAPRPTTFVSSKQLTAALSAGDMAVVSGARVTVATPAPGGGVSPALIFTITAAPAAPASPISAPLPPALPPVISPAPAPSVPALPAVPPAAPTGPSAPPSRIPPSPVPSSAPAASPSPAPLPVAGTVPARDPAPSTVSSVVGSSSATRPPIAAPLLPIPAFTDTPEHRFFPATDHSLNFGFKAFWEANGGIALFGLPISEEFTEREADGAARTVQYFERARFEYHKEFTGTPYEVELGLLAEEVAAGRTDESAFQPVNMSTTPGESIVFPATGHTLAGPFRTFWETNGGLLRFGLPISEPFPEVNADTGQAYLVQYFERYRLEYHPEGITLGRLGVQDAQLRGYFTE
jgi:hypothetical protein